VALPWRNASNAYYTAHCAKHRVEKALRLKSFTFSVNRFKFGGNRSRLSRKGAAKTSIVLVCL